MKPILEIKNISKKFRIGHEQQPYLSLRDRLANIFKETHSVEDFWALNDVSFDVMPGDTVGIIGKNGAGKSTLLKILSRITPPTKGKIICRGRIASLLEVGTGFHPELSGRENIFLNGSILGMKRVEIQKQFDAIVDFAGVEKFIDTPLKHYSSGMQLRLAFAVAAFLEPEILIIDEVLAVGDAEFQKKCMGKMGEVSKSGRTILFVSHQLGSVSQLCEKAILMHQGSIGLTGNAQNVINRYLEGLNKTVSYSNSNKEQKEVYFTKIELDNKSEINFHDNIYINFDLAINKLDAPYSLFVSVLDKNKLPVFSSETKITKPQIQFCIEKNFLTQGSYSINAIIHHLPIKQVDVVENVCAFNVVDTDSEFLIYNNFNYNYGNVFGKCFWKNL
jgi:lipopolysaccharide transport system ATP-binding protein